MQWKVSGAGLILLLIPVIISGSLLAGAQEKVIAPSGVTALTGATIIDGTGSAPRRGETIIIRGDRIAAVGAKAKVPAGATVIDVAGKTVIPGLIDMHGHMYARATPEMRSQFEAYPLLYLAGGVTAVRSPGDYEPEGMVALRERIKRGEMTGPRIFTAGPYFDADPSQVKWIKGTKTPEEAVALFNQWKDRIDYLKFYTRIGDEQFKAVIEAAQKAKIPVTGHLGSITATRAIELGINGLEHGIFAMSELSKGAGANQANACPLGDLDLGSPLVEKLVAEIVRKRVVIDPTVIVFQVQHPDFEPVVADWLKYLSPEGQANQKRLLEAAAAGRGSAPADCLARSITKQLAFIKKVHDRGGIVVTGTDPVSPRLIPGYGLQREIKTFVTAGLTPVEAIKAATLNGAIGLRREKEFGSIEAGKLADLVVIGGDLASNIGEISRTEIVFRSGVKYDPAALRKSAEGGVK
jgi:imidazolonepropionase-like amidohydrolase